MPPHDLNLGQREVGKHFKCLQVLGSGSFSTAFLVERLADGKQYALKQTDLASLPPHVRQDVVNEARLLASLRHTHIVRYHEAFMDAEFLCVVMEALEGGDLSKLIKGHRGQGEWIPEDVIWSYLLQVGSGLRHLHSRNIMHRDVKPQNVLRSGDGVVKLVDLGIAKHMRSLMTSTLIGTPHYMSPAVWQEQPYSFGCDVWSLGCMLYEMAALRPPFEGATIKQLRLKVLMGRLERIPAHYSDDLWLTIRSMLTGPEHLRPDMAEIHAALVERRHLLPAAAAAAAAADAMAGGGGMPGAAPAEPSLLSTIYVPDDLSLLNEQLPPAAYEVGRSVLEHMLEQQRAARRAQRADAGQDESAAGDWAPAVEGAAPDALEAGRAVAAMLDELGDELGEPGGEGTGGSVGQAHGSLWAAGGDSAKHASKPYRSGSFSISAVASGAGAAPPPPPAPAPASPGQPRTSPLTAALLAWPQFVAAIEAAFCRPSAEEEDMRQVIIQGAGQRLLRLHAKYAALVIRDCGPGVVLGEVPVAPPRGQDRATGRSQGAVPPPPHAAGAAACAGGCPNSAQPAGAQPGLWHESSSVRSSCPAEAPFSLAPPGRAEKAKEKAARSRFRLPALFRRHRRAASLAPAGLWEAPAPGGEEPSVHLRGSRSTLLSGCSEGAAGACRGMGKGAAQGRRRSLLGGLFRKAAAEPASLAL